MTVNFEDYEAMTRSEEEGNEVMKRIDEAKSRRTRMERRQQKARIIWLVTVFLLAAFLLFILLWLHPRASADEKAGAKNPGEIAYVETAVEDMAEDFENEKIEAALYETGYFRADIPLDGETQAFLRSACEEAGITYELALAVIRQETDFRNVVGDNGDSIGYMQIQPRWHEERMERMGVTDLADPYSNFRVGCDFLAELLEKYTLEKALTSYNSGKPGKSEYATSVIGYMEEYNRAGEEEKHENYT